MESKRLPFTVAALKALPLPPPGQRHTYHDTKEPGLQLRVASTGKKQFCVFKRARNGPPERYTIGPFPDLSIEQARAKALEIKNRIAMGENPAQARRERRLEMTLGEAFEWYLRHCALPEGLKTVEQMRGNFERYLGELGDAPRKKHGRSRRKSPGSVNWQDKKLSTIRPADVARLRADLAAAAGNAAANHALKLLRAVFNKLIAWQLFPGPNPVQSIALLKIKARERFLQKDELVRLFDVLEQAGAHIRDYILLSIYTGGRRSNVLAMRWEEIDWDGAAWRIPDTKNGEPLVVPLAQAALALLRHRQIMTSGDWVFPGRGASGHMVSPKKGVAWVLEHAGIENLRLHDFRRTLGSWQANTGASLSIIGKSLGHRSLEATQIYARLSQEPVRESIERAIAAMGTRPSHKPRAQMAE